jgi:transposase
MAQPRCIDLTAAQVEELQWVRDHHQKAYMRERAAAILKVASGLSMLQVALHGLLKPRRYETISEWISRYERGGVEGLQVQAGRGRKPAFSPCGCTSRS